MGKLWDELCERFEILREANKKYIAMYHHDGNKGCLLKVYPQDENELHILTMCGLMHKNIENEPIQLRKGTESFTCSLVKRNENEFLFIANHEWTIG